MSFQVSSYINLYRLPSGRRAFAHKQVIARATEHQLPGLVTHATAAREHDQATQSLERQRLAARRSSYPPETQQLDNEMDRRVAGLESFFLSQRQSFRPEHPRHQAAVALSRALFPTGTADIIRLSYVQEHEAVDILLKQLDSDRLKPHVDALPELSLLVDGLREANAEYGDALQEVPDDGPSGEELRAARDHGQEMLVQTVALIMAQYVASGDGEQAAYLVQPIMTQNEAVRLSRQRRRRPIDVDPNTGDETGEETTDDDNGTILDDAPVAAAADNQLAAASS